MITAEMTVYNLACKEFRATSKFHAWVLLYNYVSARMKSKLPLTSLRYTLCMIDCFTPEKIDGFRNIEHHMPCKNTD